MYTFFIHCAFNMCNKRCLESTHKYHSFLDSCTISLTIYIYIYIYTYICVLESIILFKPMLTIT